MPSTSSVTVRPIETGDEQQWRALWEKYNEFYKRTIPDAVTTETFRRFLDDSVRSYAAVAVDSNGAVIGFVTWLPHLYTGALEDQVYLGDLYVNEDVRNAGTGRALIQHVYDWSAKNDIHSVYWHTQHFNHRAQLLYTKVADKTVFVQYSKKIKDA